MCGIVGIADTRGVDEAVLTAAAESIRHRGPDDFGTFVAPEVGLAAVRLAILDLSPAGHQPMLSDDGSVALVYNGELYNYRELARELETRGHRFRSHTDTEVVLHAYEEWGRGAVTRFNGMFAFAVWDGRTRELLLARDRFGVKPLYYSHAGGRFSFASEIKALLAAGLRCSVSPEALVEYFTFQNVLSDRTLFDGVRILPPGHTLTLREGAYDIDTYWDLELDPDDTVDAAAWTEQLHATFAESVERHLMSDVPLGSFLSGGMDSASIVSVASSRIPRLMTFTGGFDLSAVDGLELVFDERADAERVASRFRTEHYEMVMHSGDMWWVLPELVWHLEDLRVGMAYQNHYIARLASKFVKVALAGTGGDELFAGYPWRYEQLAEQQDAATYDDALYAYWSRLVPAGERASFFEPDVLAAAGDHDPFDVLRAAVAPARDLDPLSKTLYFEAKTFLHGLLVVEDRVSMAHSLEARVPFLDNELVELARRIPSQLKRGSGGKAILREAMRGLLPEDVLTKPKQGFSPPDDSWYRGHSMERIRALLLDPRTLERGYFRADKVRAILDEHASARRNHRLLIWSLLCFEWWNRLFVDGDAPARHRTWHAAEAALSD